MVRIAFFNDFVDIDYLEKICRCKVINSTLCVSSEIRLRKYNRHYVTLHTDEWKSNIIEYCYGMLFDIEVEDFDVFSIYHSLNSICKKIKVSTIEVKNVDDFMNNDYKITNHNVECLCFVADKGKESRKAYNNRHNKVNFNSRLLLNLLKI